MRFTIRSCLLLATTALMSTSAEHIDNEACIEMSLGEDFTQATAPTDISKVERVVLQRANKIIQGLISVSISFSGSDIKGKEIGSREIKTFTERLDDGKVIKDCLLITYNVSDTNECTTTDPAWKHNCDSSAVCVNTIGSYECACKDGTFGKLNSGSPGKSRWQFGGRATTTQGLCWGHPDSQDCCHNHGSFDRCDVEACVKGCLSDFKCVEDPCDAAMCPAHSSCIAVPESSHPDMWASSVLTRRRLRGGFKCICDEPFYEDDPEGGCKLKEKVDLCANHSCPCDCHCVANEKEGGYTCNPDKGFRKVESPGSPDNFGPVDVVPRRMDSGICVSTSVPKMQLIGKDPVRLKQGESYFEEGANIVDDDLQRIRQRRITISYPDGPLGQCVSTMGTYKVKYELDDVDQFTSATPIAAKYRSVIVSDVDECTYDGPCLEFQAQCAPNANCINLPGTYNCSCPSPGYRGNGRMGVGGTGCIDTVEPIIQCEGRGCEPKVFHAADFHAFMSEDGQFNETTTSDLSFARLKIEEYHAAGLEAHVDPFCETASAGRPCFIAFDDVFDVDPLNPSRFDLTSKVKLGPLIPLESDNHTTLRFHVEYSVVDASGNLAKTHREIVVTAVPKGMLDQLTTGNVAYVLTQTMWYTFIVSTTILLALLLWTLSGQLTKAILVGPFAIVYGLLPIMSPALAVKLLGSRARFMAAADLWLVVSSLGTLSQHERLRIAMIQWRDLQWAYDEMSGAR